MSTNGWIILLLVVIVFQLGIIMLFLEGACKALDGIREGTDPAKIARRYERL